MPTKLVLNYVSSIDVCLLVITLVLVIRGGGLRRVLPFAGLLAIMLLQGGLDVAVLYHRKALGMSPATACTLLRYGGWVAELGGTVLLLLSVYGVFQSVMSPFEGLHRVGQVMFRWVGAIAVCLACVVMFSPHAVGATDFATLCGQFQEGTSLLTLCLLLAVSMAARPLGLSAQSRSFGTLLGLGLLAASSLVEATWFGTLSAQSLYSAVHLIGAGGCLLGAATWVFYFARPEPARRMITLPTTSPFFFWNRIAEALGDAPGEVVVGGISPSMFAPAELLAFSAAPRQPAPVVEMPKIAQR